MALELLMKYHLFKKMNTLAHIGDAHLLTIALERGM